MLDQKKAWCSGKARRLARRLVRLVLVAEGCLSLLGCDRGFCVEGVDLGTRYRVNVLERASESSEYAVQTSRGPDFGMYVPLGEGCGTNFDLSAGSTFEFEPVSRFDLGECDVRIGRPSEVPQIQLLQEIDEYGLIGGTLMKSPLYSADRLGCTGEWQISFLSPKRTPPLSVPVVGQHPPVLLERIFVFTTTDGRACGRPGSSLVMYSSCTDYFVVGLSKL